MRHTSEKEQWALASKLAQSEEQVRHLEKRVAVLTKRSEAECIALGFKLTVDERVQGNLILNVFSPSIYIVKDHRIAILVFLLKESYF